jgi:hypothetical protein
MLYLDRMPSIMPATTGFENASGCPIALSTLSMMLPMIYNGSGGSLAHDCSTITSSYGGI